MNIKHIVTILIGTIFILNFLTGCSEMNNLKTDGQNSNETNGYSVLNEKPVSEYENDRNDIGLSDENYQKLHEQMSGLFGYESLNDVEKIWYLDICQIVQEMQVEIALYDGYFDQLKVENIDKIFSCVLMDHPEFFYVDGYTYTHFTSGEETVRIMFSGTYTMTLEEVLANQELINTFVEEFLTGIPQDMSDYEKTKYVYEYLIENTDYNLTAPDNQNICSVFIHKESVCQGYAKATQYLLNRLLVPTTIVSGEVNNGQGHAWNLVLIDGKYYYVDTTWGDVSYQTENADVEIEMKPSINYDYLCVTTEQILKTHTIKNVVPVPLCRNMEANYYVVEGAYFRQYDEEALRCLFDNAYEQEREDITIKCGSKMVYNEMIQKLIEEQKIFEYIEDSFETIAYTNNDMQLSITFWLQTE